jgi:hypothetical protein
MISVDPTHYIQARMRVDDNALRLQSHFPVTFTEWVTSRNHKWETLAKRRSQLKWPQLEREARDRFLRVYTSFYVAFSRASTAGTCSKFQRECPAITQITFLACRAHYPDGSNRCDCRFLPCSCCLPRLTGGSASATSLSRPAQASLTLRPTRLLPALKRTFVPRLRPGQLPDQAAR